uniref:Uncharacterized protein n=1 Tax=Oryza brachyantha TaxID=4533 RepID=J3NC60_ORYBR
MGFVTDRLSVVSFTTDACQVLRLTRMTENGKLTAQRVVDFLVVHDSTNIHVGLDEATKVLDTFGFSTDHDVAAMHSISDNTFSFIENLAIMRTRLRSASAASSRSPHRWHVSLSSAYTPECVSDRSKSSRCENHIDVEGRTTTGGATGPATPRIALSPAPNPLQVAHLDPSHHMQSMITASIHQKQTHDSLSFKQIPESTEWAVERLRLFTVRG